MMSDLKLCKAKSKAMLFSRNRRKKVKLENLKRLKIDDNDIEYTECMNYLGVNKLNNAKCAISKKWGLTPGKARWLYTAIIRPTWEYGSAI